METTCVLIKPDAMLAHRIGEIIARFEKAGLAITDCKMISLDQPVLASHYAHLLDKPFFPEVLAFMQSSPVIALAVTGTDAVTHVRALAGPTNPAKAAPGTIRADFGTDVMANAIHASDSPEAAVAELARFGLGGKPA
jgi:nucleoside-diphosphate kinase